MKFDEKEIIDLYTKQKFTQMEICNKYKIGKKRLLAVLKKNNIPLRTRSESAFASLSRGRLYKFDNDNRWGERNNHWKGGKTIRDGYINTYCPNHPYAHKKGKGYKRYVREHRLVMEKHLGRFLKPSEVVHHINGIRTDNRIENLMLFPSNSEHMKFHQRLKKINNNYE